MAKFSERALEPSSEIIAQVVNIKAQISELKDQIAALRHEKSKIVSEEARRCAQLKTGDVVEAFYRRNLTPHRITRVVGSWCTFGGHYRILVEYDGQPKLKSGWGDAVRVFPERTIED